jgi:hypothetical protein
MNLAAAPLILLSLIVSPFPSPPRMSGFMNAERLIAHCRPAADAEVGMAEVCMGYVAGSVDQILHRQAQLPSNKRTICLPAEATIGEVQDAVVANLEMFADDPNIAAAAVVERSLTAVFPC